MPVQRRWAKIDETLLRRSLHPRVHLSLFVSLFVSMVLSACHRTDFDADQTTVCPEPEGSLLVAQHTVHMPS